MGKDAAPSTGGVKDWETLRKVAKQGFSDGIMCLATIQIVERSNRSSVIEPLNQAQASRAARILVDASLVQLHLYLVRAFARVSHDDDLHLHAAINYLRTADIKEHVWHPPLRDDLRTAIELFEIAKQDPRLAELKRLRDKRIAHLGKYDEEDAPTYNDLFGFAHVVAEIWERLAWGTGIVSLSISSQVEAYIESAEAFWSHWEHRASAPSI